MEKENVIPNISLSGSPLKHYDSPLKHYDSPLKQNKLLNSGKKGSPAHKSPSRAPVSTKIQFYEQNDANAANSSDKRHTWYFPEIKEKIQFYERLFIGSKTPGKRDVVIKHEDWKRMINDLLSQVQAKEAQLRDNESKMESADKVNDELLAAYPLLILSSFCKFILINNTRTEIARLNAIVEAKAQEDSESKAMAEMREKIEELERANKDLRDANKILDAQATQDKHYSQCAEEKVEQLMVDLIAEQEKNSELQSELERTNAEIANLTQTLINRNSELKLYKSKVENFLEHLENRTVTPTKKRQSMSISDTSSVCSSGSSSYPGSASKKPRPSPSFTSPSPRFQYKFDPTRYEK